METILFALWFFWPAGSANSAPVLANNTPLRAWTTPIDFGHTFRGHRITGDHKTYRGLTAGVINGAVIGLVQLLLARNISFFESVGGSIDYTDWSVILLGAVLGLGALLGDVFKSFFKRQRNIPNGHSWFPFDQTDYIIGGLLFSLLFVHLELREYIAIFLIYAFLHPIANVVGWLLKLKPRPF